MTSIQLTSDQALVLFEFLARFDQDERLVIEDPAEERVLWCVTGQLEKALVEPFDPAYRELLAAARARVVAE